MWKLDLHISQILFFKGSLQITNFIESTLHDVYVYKAGAFTYFFCTYKENWQIYGKGLCIGWHGYHSKILFYDFLMKNIISTMWMPEQACICRLKYTTSGFENVFVSGFLQLRLDWILSRCHFLVAFWSMEWRSPVSPSSPPLHKEHECTKQF